MPTVPFEKRQERREWVDSLTPTERGVLAEMVMRSLRGSWRSPRERTYLLEAITKTGDVEWYDAETLAGSVATYFEHIGRGFPDGRYWRRIYQKSDADITAVDEDRARELASRIPDDRTWDDHRFARAYDETDGGDA